MLYGTVEFEGKQFALTEQAHLTNRLMRHSDYSTVPEGADFQFEMSASGKSADGTDVIVYWIFWDVKGQEPEEQGRLLFLPRLRGRRGGAVRRA